MIVVPQSVELRWITPNALEEIEFAGRIAWKSEDRITETSAEAFVKTLIDKQHLSVIEHASASFHIITERSVAQELTRHRLFSVTMESARFCNYSKDKFSNQIRVVQPPELDEPSVQVWKDSIVQAEAAYMKLIANTRPELARSVLPMCLKTELVLTGNFRQWRNFLQQRLSKTAKIQPQTREVAYMILNILKLEVNVVFDDIT